MAPSIAYTVLLLQNYQILVRTWPYKWLLKQLMILQALTVLYPPYQYLELTYVQWNLIYLILQLYNEQQPLKRLWKKLRSLELSAKWQMPLICVIDPRQLQFMVYHLTHLYQYGEKDLQANLVTSLVYRICLILKIRPILYNFFIDLLTSVVQL